jgi:phage terminase Nu1 subunit (DNA packaging protein)|nr:MAG TPA: Redirecting phage packaging protein C packaging protein, DNA Binding [Bacteriophage sp.]
MSHMKNINNLTAAELAQSLRVHKNTVSMWARMGMPCIYIGRVTEPRRGARPRYDLEKVKAWLEERSKKRTSVA